MWVTTGSPGVPDCYYYYTLQCVAIIHNNSSSQWKLAAILLFLCDRALFFTRKIMDVRYSRGGSISDGGYNGSQRENAMYGFIILVRSDELWNRKTLLGHHERWWWWVTGFTCKMKNITRVASTSVVFWVKHVVTILEAGVHCFQEILAFDLNTTNITVGSDLIREFLWRMTRLTIM